MTKCGKMRAFSAIDIAVIRCVFLKLSGLLFFSNKFLSITIDLKKFVQYFTNWEMSSFKFYISVEGLYTIT